MPKYNKTNWVNGETILKAEHMQKIEQGIVDLCTEIENITLEATDLSNYYTKTQTDNKISEEIAKAQLGGSGEVDLSAYATKNYVDNEISQIELKEGPQGPKGDKGDKGDRGEQGVSISSITEYYQVSTSNTVVPSSWLTVAPALTPTNKYLWNYRRIDYTDGSAVASDMRVIGVYGDSGTTPNVSIGNVSTLEPGQNATVTRRGTDANPIFDFGIPKGEKGEPGGMSSDDGSSGVVGDKLISKFIYNSNKVIQPISLNKETGVFTCSSPHGLSDGEKLVLALNYEGNYNVTWVPYELYLANPLYQYNCLTVTVVSDIEFKIKSYGSNSEMLFTNSKNTNIDVSKFRFESLGANSLSITNLPLQENTSKLKISIIANGFEINEGSKIDGLLNNTAVFSHHFLGKNIGVGFNIVPWVDYFSVGRFQRPFHTRLETLIVVRDEYSFVDGVVFKAGISTSNDASYKASWNSSVKEGRFNEYCTQGRLDGIKFNNSFKISLSDSRMFMNGTIIEVYEVGGE